MVHSACGVSVVLLGRRGWAGGDGGCQYCEFGPRLADIDFAVKISTGFSFKGSFSLVWKKGDFGDLGWVWGAGALRVGWGCWLGAALRVWAQKFGTQINTVFSFKAKMVKSQCAPPPGFFHGFCLCRGGQVSQTPDFASNLYSGGTRVPPGLRGGSGVPQVRCSHSRYRLY